jgi:hypothetical protein
VTTDMLSWLRQQIELRRSLAELASGESWAARRVMDVGYMVADKDSGTAVARLWVEMGDLVDGFHSAGANPLDTSKHIAFNDPRQIIADCETDLEIADLHGRDAMDACRACGGYFPCLTLLAVVSRYRHRPGYLPEWAPEGATP